jgi:hypothetical protein
MSPVQPQDVLSSGFSTLARAGTGAAAALSWDPRLRRSPRVLVPMDVQALAIPAGDRDPAAQVLSALPDPQPAGSGPAPAPAKVAPFTDAPPRAAGVYLHWAAVDGLAAARAPAPGAPVSGEVTSPPLADRWLVVRLASGTPRRTRAWVVEAEHGLTVDLAAWSAAPNPQTPPSGRTPHLDSAKLTAMAGGDPAWAAVFDTAQDRFGIYDPLDDLSEAERRATVSYLVCGWWSQDANDPLYAGTLAERRERLNALGWVHSAVAPEVQAARDAAAQRGAHVGLTTPGTRTMEPIDSADQAGGEVAQVAPHELLAGAAAEVVAGGAPPLPQLTLLHGSVIGVLPNGPAEGGDDRPAVENVEVAVGASATEAFAAMLALDRPADQQIADERLVAAFCEGLISQLDAPDGLVTLDQELQAAEFVSQPGGPATTDRLLQGDRIAAARAKADAPQAVSDFARAAAGRSHVLTSECLAQFLVERSSFETVDTHAGKSAAPTASPQLTPRNLTVAAPAWRFPADPVVTLRALNRSLRHGHDGRFSADGTLACRVSGEERTRFAGLLDGSELVAPLGNGGLPPECDELLRELALDDVTQLEQTAAFAAQARSLPLPAVTARLQAEHALRWDTTAAPAGRDALAPASLRVGSEPSPVATTYWRQPWVPLFLEWELALSVDDEMDRWQLAEVDLDVAAGASPAPGPGVAPIVVRGRVLLTSMVARQFAAKVAGFVSEEKQRGSTLAVLRPDEQTALSELAQAGARSDVLSGGLQGLREELLGLAWADAGRVLVDGSGNRTPPTPVRVPVLLRGGVASFTRMRVVDAFGRTVEIPSASIAGSAIAERLQVPALAPAPGPAPTPGPAPAPTPAPAPDTPAPQLLLRPRLMRPARLELDFADPKAADGTEPALATVDQVDPSQAINPVCGWLLPDHLDGALEVFDGAAQPLGMLLEDLEGRVVWEGAPGLPGPLGAPPAPLPGDDAGARHVVRLAAAVVVADAAQRTAAANGAAPPPQESALSALLRTIDTTLWTVDPFGATGKEHVAGLVGRPIAVVRMTLRLSVLDDLATGPDAELTLPADVLAARRRAYDRLASRQIAVRLGELTRTDDGVLGYFVDDDYTRFTPVSPEVLAAARAGGRQSGQLSVLGSGSAGDPAVAPITHPFVDDAEQPLLTRPGQRVALTVLMTPGGSAHATTGVLPRVRVSPARDWVADALQRLSPSFRVGPVLVDPKTVRLPRITALPQAQVLTARTDETTWKDSPIAAATQDALLPDEQPLFREGYIRVAQTPPAGPATTAAPPAGDGAGKTPPAGSEQ